VDDTPEKIKHWRAKAAEARTLSEKTTDSDLKKRLLRVALSYDAVAEDAAARFRSRWPGANPTRSSGNDSPRLHSRRPV
jgi:hypothetical protein